MNEPRFPKAVEQISEPEAHEKISSTAIGVAYGRTFTDIPYSQEISDICGTDTLSEDSKEMHRGFAPFFEGRFKAITNALKESGVRNILEVASGLAPRDLLMTQDGDLYYLETDLPGMIEQKQRLLAKLLEQKNTSMPSNLHFAELNVLDASAFEKIVAEFPEGPIAIAHEGLLVYFSREEKEAFAKIVHAALSKRDGVWITTDILTQADLARNVPDKKTKDSMEEINQQTGRNYNDKAFRDTEDAQQFFADLGFDFTSTTFAESAGEIASAHIGLDEEYVKAQLQGTVWTLRVKK